MNRKVRTMAAASGALVWFCASSAVQSAPPAPSRAETIQALYDCQKLVGDSAQLTCYVQATDKIKDAEQSGKLVIVDHQMMREKRRSEFGLKSLGLEFKGDAKKDAEPLSGLDFEIERTFRRGDGTMVFFTKSGVVWSQTESRELPGDPVKGSKLVVKRGSLGSYFCTPEKMFTVECRRSQ